MSYIEIIKTMVLMRGRHLYTESVLSYEEEAMFDEYDKNEDGESLSCCGDVLTEENGGICESCGEHC